MGDGNHSKSLLYPILPKGGLKLRLETQKRHMFAAKSNHQNYMLVNCKTWLMVLVSIVINCFNFLFMNGFVLRPFDLPANRAPNLDNGVTFKLCKGAIVIAPNEMGFAGMGDLSPNSQNIRCNALRLWAPCISPYTS